MAEKEQDAPNKSTSRKKALGFTFYPQDWWTSDSFYDFNLEERYIYLECLFHMYMHGGYMNISREQLEKRLITQIKPSTWKKITQQLTQSHLGYSHNSVVKRRTKAEISRDNGRMGGRPKKPRNPAKNPAYKYNIKEEKKNLKETVSDGKEKNKKGSDGALPQTPDFYPSESVENPYTEEDIKKNWNMHIKTLSKNGVKNTEWYQTLMMKCKGIGIDEFNAAATDVKLTMLTENKIHEKLGDFKKHLRNVVLVNYNRSNNKLKL